MQSISGRKNTASLDPRKLDYIKTVVHSRVPDKPKVEFEYTGDFAAHHFLNLVRLCAITQGGSFERTT